VLCSYRCQTDQGMKPLLLHIICTTNETCSSDTQPVQFPWTRNQGSVFAPTSVSEFPTGTTMMSNSGKHSLLPHDQGTEECLVHPKMPSTTSLQTAGECLAHPPFNLDTAPSNLHFCESQKYNAFG
jgi:hypothetical protein